MLRRLREAQLGQATLHHPPAGWSSTLVKRLQLERTLEGHDGCVNTVHFSPCGQLLVSGSDDMQIFFWDWHLGTRTLAFHSGHHNNVRGGDVAAGGPTVSFVLANSAAHGLHAGPSRLGLRASSELLGMLGHLHSGDGVPKARRQPRLLPSAESLLRHPFSPTGL